MTQDRDRLDRIEAALDRQVEVNADLRTSTSELRATAEALLATVQVHQQNFEVIAAEMRTLRTDVSQVQEVQRSTSAALRSIEAILDYLVRGQGG